MNPSQPENAGSLPAPELGPLPEQTGEQPAGGLETAARPERTPAQAVPTLPTDLPAISLPTSMPATPPAASAKASDHILTDDDLIEKEWVNKAKRIVEQTREDPYKQSENLTVFKADYIKQHYGKTIKLSR